MKIELKNNITQDRYTKYICESFDIQDNKESKVIVEANLDNIPKDFNVSFFKKSISVSRKANLEFISPTSDSEIIISKSNKTSPCLTLTPSFT